MEFLLRCAEDGLLCVGTVFHRQMRCRLYNLVLLSGAVSYFRASSSPVYSQAFQALCAWLRIELRIVFLSFLGFPGSYFLHDALTSLSATPLQGTAPSVWRKMRDLEKSWKPRKFAVLMTERDEVNM